MGFVIVIFPIKKPNFKHTHTHKITQRPASAKSKTKQTSSQTMKGGELGRKTWLLL